MSDKFCVYLTIYEGTQLPPYYIGSSTIKRVSEGYMGSVCSKKYKAVWDLECSTFPDLFDTIVLSEHETRKRALAEELRLHILHNVVISDEYINMSLAQANGCCGMDVKGSLNPNYGKGLHGEAHPMFGKQHLQETKDKMSIAHKGKVGMVGKDNPMYGKEVSQETRKKISESITGELNGFYGKHHSESTKAKLREINKGKILSAETRRKISESGRNKAPYIHKERTCPHCGKTGRGGNMKRYHFENCKEAKDV